MSKPADAHWIKFYPSDWLNGTVPLTAVERGVYITLIAMMYDRQGPLPLNRKELARRCAVTPKVFDEALETLVEMGKISEHEGAIFNEKTAKILNHVFAKSEQAKRAGRIRQGKTEEKQGEKSATAEQPLTKSSASANRTVSDRSAILDARILEDISLGVSTESNNKYPSPAQPSAAGPGWAEDSLEGKLRRAADWLHPEPRLAQTGAIAQLIADGADLDLDVIPTVRALAPAVNSRTSWKYFTGAIADARDARLKAKASVGQPASNPADAPPAQVAVIEGTEAWQAWTRQRGRPYPTTDIREPGKQIRRGWYFPSEFPPGYEPKGTGPPDEEAA